MRQPSSRRLRRAHRRGLNARRAIHVAHLLTFNAPDFARYAEISAIAPDAAAAFPTAE